jgi:MULE transposase domain
MSTQTATSSSFDSAEDHVELDLSSLVPTGSNEGRRATVHEQSVRRRAVWTAQKSVHPSILDNELEAFGPLSKCETKCDKTYYRCPFKKRFNCSMVIRTIREVVTGHIVIETCGSGHSHNDSEERFQRGLSNAVKEAVVEITKFNNRIRPQALQRALITVPFQFSMSDVKIEKITSYLHRIRQTKTSSYIEHTVSGLWNVISSRQFDENSSDWAKYFFTVTPDQVFVDAGTSDARVQIFATTRSLLDNIRQISRSACGMQVVLDSKHRVLMNNYPVTVLGVLDAGQQFNLVALAVSNKEDEEFYTSFVKSIQTQVQNLGIRWAVDCTMSDNCDAIQNTFETCFPQSLRGN